MMRGEEVRDIKTLAKIQSVDEMIPKASEENLIDVDVALPTETEKKKAGRPSLTEKHFKIVEESLKLDCTIEEACMLA